MRWWCALDCNVHNQVAEAAEMTARRYLRLASNRTKHPIGSGIPGPENWSGTDNATIRETPLGGIPELVGWSVSMVLTPHGWVGRIDNHITGKTAHLEVEPSMAPEYEDIGVIRTRKQAELEALRKEWAVEAKKKGPKGEIEVVRTTGRAFEWAEWTGAYNKWADEADDSYEYIDPVELEQRINQIPGHLLDAIGLDHETLLLMAMEYQGIEMEEGDPNAAHASQ